MSKNYSKTDQECIVKELVEYLRECEDGTDITTCQLLRKVGYDEDEFDQGDLFDIHDLLFKMARGNHIVLDMSAHENMVEGLPYNLDFIVRNKKAQIKCPYCGSKSTARILYGYPAFDKELERKIDEGKIFIGGCRIFEIPVDGKMVRIEPARVCNKCKKEFARPPLLIDRDYSSAEDYREIVTAIQFSVGGFFHGSTEVIIRKNEKGALVKVIKYPGEQEHGEQEKPEDRQITTGKWNKILDILYGKMYLHEWKKNFDNPFILDGEQWELKIKLTRNRRRNYHGSNGYPPYWDELTKIFRPFL